jgi:hypothetical protein
LISLDKFAENDFYLACGIFESLFHEFSWLEIFEKKKTNNFIFLIFSLKKKPSIYDKRKTFFN